MNAKNILTLGKLYSWLFLILLAVLPISKTIAFRNIIIIILLVILVVYIGKSSRARLIFFDACKSTPLVIFLWVVFLILFPFWAPEQSVAWTNLKGQWIESILVGLIGWGCIQVLGRQGPGMFSLAVASAVPLLLHLAVCLAAWHGLLNAKFYDDPSILNLWLSISEFNIPKVRPVLHVNDFLAGFRGVEPMHGNLGYPAGQAIILFCVCLSRALQEQNKKLMVMSALGILICFCSILIAHSRGAILYGLLVIAISTVVYWLRFSSRAKLDGSFFSTKALNIVRVTAILVFLGLLFLGYQSQRQDIRWISMLDKVELGLFSKDPFKLLCDGVSTKDEEEIRLKYAPNNPEYAKVLVDGLKEQDGGRVLLMRAGFDLVLENPMGLDGSRQAYQKLIEKKCGHIPALQFAHAHQGWLDLALALGVAGMLIYASVLVFFLITGWIGLSDDGGRYWAFSIFLTSGFWIFRGFADSVYREHNLQMQMLLISYLYWRLILMKGYKNNSQQNLACK